MAAAIDEAARHWPDDAARRSKLLLRLIEVGRAQLAREREQRIVERRRAVQETSGALAGVYPPGYLDDLRRDWPA